MANNYWRISRHRHSTSKLLNVSDLVGRWTTIISLFPLTPNHGILTHKAKHKIKASIHDSVSQYNSFLFDYNTPMQPHLFIR